MCIIAFPNLIDLFGSQCIVEKGYNLNNLGLGTPVLETHSLGISGPEYGGQIVLGGTKIIKLCVYEYEQIFSTMVWRFGDSCFLLSASL